MIYKFFPPAPALQAYVKEYLLLHFQFSDRAVNPVKAYTPRPEQCLTFDPIGRLTATNLKTGEVQLRNFSYFSSQQSTCYTLHFPPEYLMLKVVFQPGALYSILGIPLQELTGYVDASSVLYQEMRLVNEQLANAPDYSKMIQIADNYLTGKIRNIKKTALPFVKMRYFLDKQLTRFSLPELASQACLSPRQLERKFMQQIGVNPRLYTRIARFHHAWELKEKNTGWDWLTVAMACGYTDFQHLNKDFKQFAGLTPTQLLQENAQSVEKVLKLV